MGPRTRRSAGRRRSVIVVAVSIATLVAACSSDGETPARPDVTLTDAGPGSSIDDPPPTTTAATPVEPGSAEEYSAALLASLTEDPDNRGLMDATEAACVAPAWIETITPDRLGAAGLAPADLRSQRSMAAIVRVGLTVAEAEDLVDQMDGCGVDIRSRWLDAAGTTGDGGVSAESRACLEKELTGELIHRMAAVGLSGVADDPIAEETSSQFLGVLQRCGLYAGGG